MIEPANHPSRNVAGKLGFLFWKCALVDGTWTTYTGWRWAEAAALAPGPDS